MSDLSLFVMFLVLCIKKDKLYFFLVYWLFGLFFLFLCFGGELIWVVGEMYYIWWDIFLFWDK